MKKIDYLLIGPSFPYRGGIAQTQNEFALNLLKLGKNIEVFTFKKLYPKFLFPGKTQLTSEEKPSNLKIKINIHSYNPFNWIKIGKEINNDNYQEIIQKDLDVSNNSVTQEAEKKVRYEQQTFFQVMI